MSIWNLLPQQPLLGDMLLTTVILVYVTDTRKRQHNLETYEMSNQRKLSLDCYVETLVCIFAVVVVVSFRFVLFTCLISDYCV